MPANENAGAVEAALAVARLEGALRDAGLRGERVAAAVKIADVSALKVDGTEVSGLAETVESIKAQSPEWFGEKSRRYSAPDASLGNREDRDFRTASKATVAAELRKYNISHW
jgi:hypothetical protein